MGLPNKRIIITIIIIIFIITFINGCIFNDNGYEYRYEKIEVDCKYPPHTGILKDDILNLFENHKNITVLKVNINTFQFILNNMSDDELSQIESYLAWEDEISGRGMIISITYFIKDPLKQKLHDQKEIDAWEEKVNDRYDNDKKILDNYLFSITSIIKESFNISYASLDYSPKYESDE